MVLIKAITSSTHSVSHQMNISFVFIKNPNSSTIRWRGRSIHSFYSSLINFILHIRVVLGFDVLVISRMDFIRLIFVCFLAIILGSRCLTIILTKFILTTPYILIRNIRNVIWPTVSTTIRPSVFSLLFLLNIMNV